MREPTEQRIAVIGAPGAGKSTLATAVARATGLPLIHLDQEHWQANWVEPDAAEWQARSRALIAGERWVIDGLYGSSLAERVARATLVIWLDLPTRTCLAGVLARTWRYRGRDRPDMAAGCPERLDREYLTFLHFVATFRRRVRPRVERAVTMSEARVVRLTSAAERAGFLRRLADGGLASAKASPG